MHQPATIKDVALKAGCGVATVSRVLNNTGSASTEMRKRVTAAVKELDFQFSEVGRSLQSSTTRTIGFIVPSIANPVYADALQGAQEVLTISGYQMLLICTNYSPESELSAIRTLISKQVAGIVLTVSDAERSQGLSIIKDRRLPYCLLYNNTSVNQESWSVDDEAAAKRVAQAFSENLHNQTGFLALNFNKSDRARQRYEGYCAGCKARGMNTPKLLEISEEFEDLTFQLKQFLSENPSITGIFASNDFLALAIIRSARKLALNVPRDLSIIGFDGIEVHGAHGYLIDNFFWEGTNIREDEYGGTTDKRSKFVTDIIKAIRSRVSDDFIVGLRFSQWKQHDFNAKLADTSEELEKVIMPPVNAGLDYLHSSMRRFLESEFPNSDENLAYWTKKISNITTIGVGSVGLDTDFIDMTASANPTSIDRAIEDISQNKYELIAVGRALIADPDWVIKMKTGRLSDVKPYTKESLFSLY